MTTDFSALIQSSTREDEYVNATKLCKQFNYRLARWKELPETIARKKAFEKLAQNVSINFWIVEGSGRGAKTWLHPVAAIHLAQYISPEFANYVAEVFKAYLTADINLAKSVVQRTDDLEGLKKLTTQSAERVKQLEGYRDLMDELKTHGCEGKHYAQVNGHNNTLIGIESRKEGLTKDEVSVLTILENFERLGLKAKPTNHAQHAVNRCKKSGTEMMQFLAGKLLPIT